MGDAMKMLILRGVRRLIDEQSAKEYSRTMGYEPIILDTSGEAHGPLSPQVLAAVEAIENDASIRAVLGFSGGAYNLIHVLNQLSVSARRRLGLVAAVGAPGRSADSYQPRYFAGAAWRVVWRGDPPGRPHMDGLAALLAEAQREVLAPAGVPAAPVPPPAAPPAPSDRLPGLWGWLWRKVRP
jgi:hypothetical protein